MCYWPHSALWMGCVSAVSGCLNHLTVTHNFGLGICVSAVNLCTVLDVLRTNLLPAPQSPNIGCFQGIALIDRNYPSSTCQCVVVFCWDMFPRTHSWSQLSAPWLIHRSHTPSLSRASTHCSDWIICTSLFAWRRWTNRKRGRLQREEKKGAAVYVSVCVCVWEGRGSLKITFCCLENEEKGLFYLRESTGEISLLILVGIVYHSRAGGDKGSTPSQLSQPCNTCWNERSWPNNINRWWLDLPQLKKWGPGHDCSPVKFCPEEILFLVIHSVVLGWSPLKSQQLQ